MVFGIQKIFSVIEAIFPVVETTVSATESIFSVAEKRVGEARAALLTTTGELE
jgi:hypothetical protein